MTALVHIIGEDTTIRFYSSRDEALDVFKQEFFTAIKNINQEDFDYTRNYADISDVHAYGLTYDKGTHIHQEWRVVEFNGEVKEYAAK